jgi:hypothetical protein
MGKSARESWYNYVSYTLEIIYVTENLFMPRLDKLFRGWIQSQDPMETIILTSETTWEIKFQDVTCNLKISLQNTKDIGRQIEDNAWTMVSQKDYNHLNIEVAEDCMGDFTKGQNHTINIAGFENIASKFLKRINSCLAMRTVRQSLCLKCNDFCF